MTKWISTQPPRGKNGKFLFGKAAARARRERYRTRPKCRICEGTHQELCTVGTYQYTKECRFCDEDGYAKFACDDCGEALPMCKCVRSSSNAAAVPSG